MDFKKEIEKLLFSLKEIGIDRRTIEKDLGYVPKSIDQILSKGGNEKALGNIKRYYIEKSNTATMKVKPDVATPENVEMKSLVQANKDLSAAVLILSGQINSNNNNQSQLSEACLERIAEQAAGRQLYWGTKEAGLVILSNILSETVKRKYEVNR